MLVGLGSFSSTSEKFDISMSGTIRLKFTLLNGYKIVAVKTSVYGDKRSRPLGQMLTSSRLNRTKQVDVFKTGLGAFHTKGSTASILW